MDLFRESCGMTGPLQLRVDYPGVAEPLQWVLYQPFALIGREPRSHLQLDHDEVSRRHAYLQVVSGRIFFTDLESRLGTQREGEPRRTGWLDEEQSIGIGPYSIHHTANGQNGSASDSAHARPAYPVRQGIPEVTLEFVNKTGRSSSWQMTPLLALVGRSPDCRVHLIGQSVSNYHCSLVRTPLGLWVVDLFGKNGVRVNGELVRQSRLDAGDQLQVGRFLIRVHYDTPPIMQYRPDFAASFKGTVGATQPAPAAEAPEIVVTPAITPCPSAAELESRLSTSLGRALMPIAAEQLVPGEEAQNFLPAIRHQLSLMQEEMVDQFQQAMMKMFQTFSSLQNEQIGAIRQELNHLQDLTNELSKVQLELSKRGQATGKAPSPAPAARAQPTQPPQKTAFVNPPRVAGTAPSSTSAAGPAHNAAPPDEQSPEALHIWLNDRVRALQEERETRWQKIVSFLGGK